MQPIEKGTKIRIRYPGGRGRGQLWHVRGIIDGRFFVYRRWHGGTGDDRWDYGLKRCASVRALVRSGAAKIVPLATRRSR